MIDNRTGDSVSEIALVLRGLLEQVPEAEQRLKDAQDSTRIAESHETACLNTLNTLQKNIYAASVSLREKSNYASDWKRNERKA